MIRDWSQAGLNSCSFIVDNQVTRERKRETKSETNDTLFTSGRSALSPERERERESASQIEIEIEGVSQSE